MKVEIQEFEPRKAACVTHCGPYFEIGSAFCELGKWIERNGIVGNAVAIYTQDPRTVPADELRSEAGVLVPDGFEPNDPRVHLVEIVGGPYAVTTHVGPYDRLGETWIEFMDSGLASVGRTSIGPCLEIYLNDCSKVAASEPRTELSVPVA